MNPVLETDRLVLRAPDRRDRAAFLDFVATERADYIGGPMTGQPAETAWGQEIAHWAMHGHGRFAVVPRGDEIAVGLVGTEAAMIWPEPELVWYLFADGEGQGFATEAGHAVLGWAHGEMGWPSLISQIEESNDRSCALAERLGGRRVHDVPSPGAGWVCYRFKSEEAA